MFGGGFGRERGIDNEGFFGFKESERVLGINIVRLGDVFGGKGVVLEMKGQVFGEVVEGAVYDLGDIRQGLGEYGEVVVGSNDSGGNTQVKGKNANTYF